MSASFSQGQGAPLHWATLDIRFHLMKRIESSLERDGGYLTTGVEPSLRPAQLEGAVLEFTKAEGGGKDRYLAQGERLLRLITGGQEFNITKDEELIKVYWDPGVSLSERRESAPGLEFQIPIMIELNGSAAVGGAAQGVGGDVTARSWHAGKTFDEKLEYILENDEGTHKDVTFYIGPHRVPISAHRLWLSMMSIVFDYAFNYSPRVVAARMARPAGTPDHLYIEIVDASPYAFKMLVKYVYCRRVDWSQGLDRATEAACLMKLAQRFEMADLVQRCVSEIKQHINEKNAPGVLASAHDLRHANLTKFSVDYIAANGRRILFGSEFRKLSRECLSMILEQDELNMAELSVINAVTRWAEYQIHSRSAFSNADVKVRGEAIRAELGPALYLIRFPLLEREVFGRHVLKEYPGLLDDHDELAIHRFGMGVNFETTSLFSARPRIHDTPARRVQNSPTRENGSDQGGSSTPETVSMASRCQAVLTQDSTRATVATASTEDEQHHRVMGEEEVGLQVASNVSSPPLQLPMDREEEREDEEPNSPNTEDIIDLMNVDIEEEMEALFNQDQTPPPQDPLDSNTPNNSLGSEQQELESSQSRASSTPVIDAPFQPPPATPSTSSGILQSPQGRPLRARKTPQRFESNDSERRTSPRRTTPSGVLPASLSQGGSDNESNSGLGEPEVSEPFLTEIQQDYIRQYGSADCENNLTSLYQNLSVMVEDTSSQQMMDTIRRDEEPIVINVEYVGDNATLLLPLYFPCLLDFHVKYLCPINSATNFKRYLNKLLPQDSLLFFNKMEEYGQSSLSALWISNIHVHLEINGIVVLKIDHFKESLTISRITQASPPLLQGLNFDCNVRQLQLEGIPVDSATVPKSSLIFLTLRNVRGFQNRTSEFVRECKNLRDLSIDNVNGETLDVVRDFGLFRDNGLKYLQKIALGNAKLDCSADISTIMNYSPVRELYLDGCTWTKEFLKCIPMCFPNLRKCKLGKSTNIFMIVDLLEIKTLEWLGVWELEFIGGGVTTTKRKRGDTGMLPLEYLQAKAKIKQVLIQAGLGDDLSWLNDKKKTFVLEKMADNESKGKSQNWDRWIGTKYEDEATATLVFSQLSYEQFGWSAFYSDYHLCDKMK